MPRLRMSGGVFQPLSIYFMFMGPCIMNHCQLLSNKMRLYTVYYISANCSTCFGWYLHPSSGAHVNFNYSIWHWSNRITTVRCRGWVETRWKAANTVWPVPDAEITVYMFSWWWLKVSPETCRAVCRTNKLYIVATCRTIIDTHLNILYVMTIH